MILFNQAISYISTHPEEAGVYVSIGMFAIAVIGLFTGKTINVKRIFNQRSGKNSQNIQGEKVNITMRNNQWK
jgi:hypothetical protein